MISEPMMSEQLQAWREKDHADAIVLHRNNIIKFLDEAARLRAEVERLKEALTQIAREQSATTALAAADKFQAIARAALAADGKC